MYKPVKCGVEGCNGHLIMADDYGTEYICDQCGVLHEQTFFEFNPTAKKILRVFWDTEKEKVVGLDGLENFDTPELQKVELAVSSELDDIVRKNLEKETEERIKSHNKIKEDYKKLRKNNLIKNKLKPTKTHIN
jgi:6-pyruvoyl-tetrahydropterin synthase